MQIPGYSLEFTPEGDVVVIRVKGTMDRNDIPVAEEGTMSLVERGYLRVAVDLSEADSVSSTGLGLILYYQKMLRKRGGRMVLVRPRGTPAGMLKLLKLENILDICDSLDEALQLARGSGEAQLQEREPV